MCLIGLISFCLSAAELLRNFELCDTPVWHQNAFCSSRFILSRVLHETNFKRTGGWSSASRHCMTSWIGYWNSCWKLITLHFSFRELKLTALNLSDAWIVQESSLKVLLRHHYSRGLRVQNHRSLGLLGWSRTALTFCKTNLREETSSYLQLTLPDLPNKIDVMRRHSALRMTYLPLVSD